MDSPAPVTALLLIAHGSREPEANADLAHVADTMRRRGHHSVVETAFLELAKPTIDQAADRCIRQGATRVLLVPYFLTAGVHVRRDLAESRRHLASRHPGIAFLLAEPLGPHPLLIQVIEERAHQAEQAT